MAEISPKTIEMLKYIEKFGPCTTKEVAAAAKISNLKATRTLSNHFISDHLTHTKLKSRVVWGITDEGRAWLLARNPKNPQLSTANIDTRPYTAGWVYKEPTNYLMGACISD